MASTWAKEVGRNRPRLEAEQILDLRQRNQHRNAVGEADDDGHRDVLDQRAELEPAHRKQQRAGQHGRDQQIRQAVALHDAVDDDDEGTGGPADLHAGAAQRRDQDAGDDGREDALLGLDARRDRKRHGQWQRDDADSDAGAEVGDEAGAVVVLERVEQARAERVNLRQGHGGSLSAPSAPASRPARAQGCTAPGGPSRRRAMPPAPCLR